MHSSTTDRSALQGPTAGGGKTCRWGHLAMPRRRHIFLKAVVHIPNFSATVWSGRWKCSHRVWPVTAAIRRPALGSSGSVASAGPSAHALPPAIPHPSTRARAPWSESAPAPSPSRHQCTRRHVALRQGRDPSHCLDSRLRARLKSPSTTPLVEPPARPFECPLLWWRLSSAVVKRLASKTKRWGFLR